MRDTKQIIAFYTSQERVINRTVNLDSLEAIEKELKFFDTNTVKLKNFDDRTRCVCDICQVFLRLWLRMGRNSLKLNSMGKHDIQ